jgi:integrase
MGLGSARDLSLAAAREKARELRAQIANGHDPLELKRDQRAAQRVLEQKRHTFQQAAQAAHAAREPGWSSDHHANEYIGSLERYAFPIIGPLDVASIDTAQVLAVLRQTLPNRMGKATGGGMFWETRCVTADRVRNRIERTLDYAKASGWRSGDNPARWRGTLDQVLPAPRKVRPVQHMKSVPFAQIPELMQVLAADQSVGAQCLRFIVLTACRPGEVIEAPWTEIDLAECLWVIPKERMKARREHRVPLAPQAMELLRSVLREPNNPFVFIGSKTPGTHINETTVADVLRRAGRKEVMHGFRASLKTFCEEQTSFPSIVAEMALAHSVGNAVERSYRRSDLFEKRRRLMEAWAAFCTVPADKSSNVLTMRGPAR